MVEWERIEQRLPDYASRKRNFAFFNQIKFQTILITTLLLCELNRMQTSTHIPHIFNQSNQFIIMVEISVPFFPTLFVYDPVEHMLCISVGVQNGQLCLNGTYIEGYMIQAWPQIYSTVQYDHGLRGSFAELLNYYCTFQWTFMDIFIISISICLSTRFNQLNEHLKQYKGMVRLFIQFNSI